MRRNRQSAEGVDLFAASSTESETPPPTALIDSPLVAETAEWLANRAVTLGNLLASDRAAEYVAILRAFATLREGHEPEPLHEDILRAVCGGEEATGAAETLFKADIRQLKEWALVTERIEKERLRGYRDTRRAKFRYRLNDDAIAFVEWLRERRANDLNPEGGDVTGNLLDLQCSLLHELRRRLNAVKGEQVDYAAAGDVLYRVEQMHVYVEATARTLQALNLRLLSFGAESFNAEEAKTIVGELGVFLERFGRRFGVLREEIAADLAELGRESNARRWTACVERLKTEAARFRHISSVRIPDPQTRLADAAEFYGANGRLVSLMERVGDSARRVWSKLNARLRELERRNHRLEDLRARLDELARREGDDVPYEWFRGLMETAAMRGDAQIRPDGEKSRAPLPKLSQKIRREKIVTWITPRTVGEKANVASIEQTRYERLKAWMRAKGVYPDAGTARLGAGAYDDFNDCRQIVQVVTAVRLGGGDKARRFLGVVGQASAREAVVKVDAGELRFEDLALKRMLDK